MNREWVQKFYKLFVANTIGEQRMQRFTPEKLICSLVSSLPCPIPGGPKVQYSLGGRPLKSIIWCPPVDALPIIDIPLVSFFQRIDLVHVLELMKCILLGEKVILVSESNTLLTFMCEALIGLLYPFKLPGAFVYIPVLGRRVIDCIDSPTAYIIGVPMEVFKKIKTIPQDATVFIIERGALVKPAKAESTNYINGSLPTFPGDALVRLTDDMKKIMSPLFFSGSCDSVRFNMWTDSFVVPSQHTNVLIQTAFTRFFAYILQ